MRSTDLLKILKVLCHTSSTRSIESSACTGLDICHDSLASLRLESSRPCCKSIHDSCCWTGYNSNPYGSRRRGSPVRRSHGPRKGKSLCDSQASLYQEIDGCLLGNFSKLSATKSIHVCIRPCHWLIESFMWQITICEAATGDLNFNRKTGSSNGHLLTPSCSS